MAVKDTSEPLFRGKRRQIDTEPGPSNNGIDVDEGDVAMQLSHTIPGVPLAALPQHCFRPPPRAITSQPANDILLVNPTGAPFRYHRAPDPIPSFLQPPRRVSFSEPAHNSPQTSQPNDNQPRRYAFLDTSISAPLRSSQCRHLPPPIPSPQRYSDRGQYRTASFEELEDED